MFKAKMILILITIILSGCGALSPKFYPADKTITSTLFPSGEDEKSDLEFERRLSDLLAGKNDDGSIDVVVPKKEGVIKEDLIPSKGKLLIISSLTGVDTQYFDDWKEAILNKETSVTGVEIISVSSLPNLKTLRLMGARQQAKYVLLLNSFSNVYRYHNAWTVPTILGLGLPYFYLDTQTIKVFSKVEYSLIDIKENIILSNESVTSDAEGDAILPESGIVQYQLTNGAIGEGVRKLGRKFLKRI